MDKHIKYWIDSAGHDLDVAESLFANAKYDWCLFIAHLVTGKDHCNKRQAESDKHEAARRSLCRH